MGVSIVDGKASSFVRRADATRINNNKRGRGGRAPLSTSLILVPASRKDPTGAGVHDPGGYGCSEPRCDIYFARLIARTYDDAR